MIYYEQNGTLVMAKDSDDMFKSFHKAKREILKDKNLLGDKAVNIREFIIDHAIAETNRPLTYFADEAMHILNIYFE
ncbi:hypothetical protein DCM91_00565 [Chitinophaga costaii]|nr:hypothetical protein DCM91_00565 [Chitinophaga costaii]